MKNITKHEQKTIKSSPQRSNPGWQHTGLHPDDVCSGWAHGDTQARKVVMTLDLQSWGGTTSNRLLGL